MRAVSIIYFRTFCIGIHTCIRDVYILWLAFVYTVLWRLIYFCQCVCTGFRIFRVPVKFLIQIIRFRTIFDEIILQSTSEARIWFPTITFITLIIGVAWIKGWFLMAFSLYLLLKVFLSWAWTSKVTEPWLSKIFSLIIFYRIFQIQTINF